MSSEERDKERRKRLMLQAVEEQLSSLETPEVREHYQRLRLLGHPDDEARELIATVLAVYIWHTLRKDDYTYADYVSALARLPQTEGQDAPEDGIG